MNEYINKRMSGPEMENELRSLIAKYNSIKNTYLFVYAAAIEKQIPGIALEQSDYYVFYDMLSNIGNHNSVDIYLETPGGKGETAEEICKFLHDKFSTVSFVISGEAKSAGTIMALSGDDILMTKTGSLGPIDAQTRVGRSTVSAHDYMEWVNEKREDAIKNKSLNPFDATMIAQISPGELSGVYHSLKFAEDLVQDWLTRYKFKKWDITETRGLPVSHEMKVARAKEIAQDLTNHTKWRSHGRSIKIDDLTDLGLKVTRLDEDQELADVVYRIQTIIRLLFESSTSFKIFATQDDKIFRQAVQATNQIRIPQKKEADVFEIIQDCQKCGKKHKLYGKSIQNPQIDKDLQKKGFKSFPKDARLICDCGFEMDLSGIKTQIELQTGKKMITL